jgi:hypothetical protein
MSGGYPELLQPFQFQFGVPDGPRLALGSASDWHRERWGSHVAFLVTANFFSFPPLISFSQIMMRKSPQAILSVTV